MRQSVEIKVPTKYLSQHRRSISFKSQEEQYYKTEMESQAYKCYGKSFLSQFRTPNLKKKTFHNRSLSSSSRTQMICMLKFISATYYSDFDKKAFFTSINIIDKYLSLTEKIVSSEETDLIALTSLFIASKFEDTLPFSSKQIVQDFGKSKFTHEMLLKKEIEILQTIGFDFVSNSVYDFLLTLLEDFKINNYPTLVKEFGESFDDFYRLVLRYSVSILEYISMRNDLSAFGKEIKAINVIRLSVSKCLKKQKVKKSAEIFVYSWLKVLLNFFGKEKKKEIVNIYLSFFKNIENLGNQFLTRVN